MKRQTKAIVANILTQWQYLSEDLLLKISGCEICERSLTKNQPLCDDCSNLIARFTIEQLSGDLLNRPEIHQLYKHCYFQHLIAIAPYQYPFNLWLTQYKYQGKLNYGKILSFLLSQQVTRLQQPQLVDTPDVIVPVPIHIKKWQQRGFNQTHALAQAVAALFNLTPNYELLSRNRHTKAQVSQSGTERRASLHKAFTLNTAIDISQKNIWLIDDVVTTGATASEISRLILAANAKSVTLVTLAVSL